MTGRERLLEWVALAGRAPSPHNVQPARWRLAGDVLELWEDPSRWLPVGDPQGRDNRIALGMAWEGMAIAASRDGQHLALQACPALAYPPPAPAVRLAARGTLRAGATPDPLHAALDARRCHRGRFEPADAARQRALDACLAAHDGVACALPADATGWIADAYDRAAAEGLDSAAFAAELYRWMRFSPRHPGWSRDGLATDCMALSRFEAWGASIALRPAVVRVLSALGLTRFVVAEGDKVRSAARLVAIHAPAGSDPFDAGRAWYRLWLALELAGFAAVPMSALADSPAAARRVADAAPLPAGRALLNVMRVGPAPAARARSARWPAAELLLD